MKLTILNTVLQYKWNLVHFFLVSVMLLLHFLLIQYFLFLILQRTAIMLSLTSKLPFSLKKYCRKVSFTIIFLFPWLLLLLRHVICKLSVPRSTLHMLHHYQRINILELINLFKLTTVTISCAKFCYIFTVTGLI